MPPFFCRCGKLIGETSRWWSQGEDGKPVLVCPDCWSRAQAREAAC